jgi:hypothetical protein
MRVGAPLPRYVIATGYAEPPAQFDQVREPLRPPDRAVHGRGKAGPNISCSSNLFLRMIGSMFMRVNSKCAYQLRPPLGVEGSGRRRREGLSCCRIRTVEGCRPAEGELSRIAFKLGV